MLCTEKLRSATYEEFCRNFSVPSPEGFNFAFDVLDCKARLTPDAPCVCHIDDSFTRREYTYRDMAENTPWGIISPPPITTPTNI